MLFSSLPFIAFFVVLFFAYYLLQSNTQWWLVLLAGLCFYTWNDPRHSWVPLLIIFVTWYLGKEMVKTINGKKKKRLLLTGVLINLFILIGFKYSYFFISVAGLTGKDYGLITFFKGMAVPLGISYISFQSIGYLVDVKNERISAEKNISHLAGFLLFFPKMIAGPVEPAEHFLPQIKSTVSFDYHRVCSGIWQFGWGLFKKLVIADRLGLFINSVYADLPHSSGLSLLITAFLFPIQLYADFSGYTDMALGLARILGYELTPNFNNPFSARSMVEFWRRWHMSLSAWFSEYIYTPLSIQKRNWGRWGAVYASTITFLILGLWHGPNWTYVAFGGIQGCVIAMELFTTKWRKNLRKNIPDKFNNLLSIVYVFILFAFSCIFFRSDNIADAGYFLSHLFSGALNILELRRSLQGHELAVSDYIVILITVPAMFFIENNRWQEKISLASKWVRWGIYYLLLIIVLVYGIPDTGFIYKQF